MRVGAVCVACAESAHTRTFSARELQRAVQFTKIWMGDEIVVRAEAGSRSRKRSPTTAIWSSAFEGVRPGQEQRLRFARAPGIAVRHADGHQPSVGQQENLAAQPFRPLNRREQIPFGW